jgi:acetaldehyde dehydrogenase
MTKVGIAILGPGLLGLALADRLRGSALLDLRLIAGREGEPGLGAIVADESIGIVFDTTGAAAHAEHAASLEAAGKRVIDLTPSAPR